MGLLLYALGLSSHLIRARGRSPRVLMYHAVEESENDFTRGLSINTTPSQFASHLAFLSRHYRIVSLAEFSKGHQRAHRGHHVRRRLPIGLRECLAACFEDHGATATCYLTTDVLAIVP